jgi:DNA-binding NtrC family response regulator
VPGDNLEVQLEKFIENCDECLRNLQRDYNENVRVLFLYCCQAELQHRQQYDFHALQSVCGSLEAAIFKECEVMVRLFLRLCSSFRDYITFLDTSSWSGSHIVELKEALRRAQPPQSTPMEVNNKELVTRGWNRMEGLIQQLRKAIDRSVSSCLIVGESGTGKELIASVLNEQLENKELTVVDCTAIPEDLIESELFGHVKGAFTGAVRDRIGQVKQAEGGTLFLDEVGLINKSFQAKLLRFIETRRYRKVGSDNWEKPVQCRIIAATSRNLETAVSDGSFLPDLYHRLNRAPITVPPLRERREDIPLLLKRYVRGRTFSPDAMAMLFDYDWPGNVRELRFTVEDAASAANEITVADLPLKLSSRYAGAKGYETYASTTQSRPGSSSRSSEDAYREMLSRRVRDGSIKDDVHSAERQILDNVLEATGGNITESAQLLKMKR